MPFTTFSFDESVGRTEPGRPHVPEGYYHFEAVKLEPTPEDYTGTTGTLLTVKFIEGPSDNPSAGVGREMRDYSALAGKKSSDGRGSQFGLGQTLGAFGLADIAKRLVGQNIDSYAKFSALCANLSKMIAGKRACGLVADQPGNNGRPFSGIEEWLPDGEWDNLKNTRLTPVAAAPRPTATAAAANGTIAPPASVTAEVDALFA